jgi:cytochrome c oxidase assembly protein subunit 15
MNTVIVVTGGAVRLTASGLGCPTFPRCTDESLIVTSEMGVHGFIEFGNRLLTFVLSAAVLAAVVTAWRARSARLLRSGLLLLAGVFAQALLGGVTVLTGLNPVTVMAHFLLSMALIAVAVSAYERTMPPVASGSPARIVRGELLLGGRALLAVVAAVIFVGTIVTGTGPHSGDKQAADRLPFDLVMVTQLHADLVFLLLGLAAGLLIALRVSDAPAVLVRRGGVLVAVALAQGTIGYIQYATNLPVAVVAAHVLGACLVWIAALRFVLALHEQPAVEPVAATTAGASRAPLQRTAASGR